MPDNREQGIRRIMSGEARGLSASLLRALLRCAEPFYSTAMRIRNALYDVGLKKQHRLPRPVISIGNITTGGTGKTPLVQWLARNLVTEGHRPASLLRGYTVGASTTSDEARLLERSLSIPVRANPNRVEAARQLIAEHPEVDVILLDDGFQHRRVRRDLNIVLIDATEPFGYGHVLPRGMLREPLGGLRRADAFIITRTNLAQPQQLEMIERTLRRSNSSAPILRANNRITSLVRDDESLTLDSLRGRRIFSFCGIGNPEAFDQDLLSSGAIDAGHIWFADHHDYNGADIEDISSRAKNASAELVVTTEKDWVKIEALSCEGEAPSAPNPLAKAARTGPRPPSLSFWRAQLETQMSDSDASQLLTRIEQVIRQAASPANPQAPLEPGEQSGR